MGDATNRVVPRAGLLIGDRYRLQRRIDSGGMAQVWEAVDLEAHRQVAVKLLHPHLLDDGAFLERFHREAAAAARLDHPGIVAVFDTISTLEVEAIVMELIRGLSLRQLLDDCGTLEQSDAVSIGVQVADALAIAHADGLVHRDVKPANILLGDDHSVHLADFGIAKSGAQTEMTLAGSLVGTATYLSPEQVQGAPTDGRSDLYSLGVVLYEALAGVAPFVGDTPAATALMRLHQSPVPLAARGLTIRPALGEVVMRCLALQPDDRYPDAASLRAALAAALTETTGELPAIAIASTPPRRRSRASSPRHPTTSSSPERATAHDAGRSAERPLRPARTRVGTIALGVLIASALAVIGLLVAKVVTTPDGARPSTPRSSSPVALQIDEAHSFDPPPGDGAESESKTALAIDGLQTTSWPTETYKVRDFGVKPGVGLLLTLHKRSRVTRVEIDTPAGAPETDWSVAVYLLDAVPTTLPARPDATASNVNGRASIETGDRYASFVLVWVTLLPRDDRLDISEVRVVGRTG